MSDPSSGPAPLRTPTLREAARVWARIGLLSFGGPAGQIALMHKELVEERRWLGEARFLHALNYCMLLPGPEAQQLATYVGWLLHGTPGGLVAGTLFVLPGLLVILALSALYAGLREVPLLSGLFFGLKAAVVAVVLDAVLRVGRRALRGPAAVALAAAAFLAIFCFAVPFPLIVLGGALGGVFGARLWPDVFVPPAAPPRADSGPPPLADALLARGALPHTHPSLRRAAGTLVLVVGLWFAPVALLALAFGAGSVFVQEGLFFSQTAVVTFGGAYAILSYVAQRAVDVFGWLRPGEMLDGLGLAETTPGPLILVVQFVAFLGAFRQPGELSPMLAGTLGALVTVWVTFVPSFLWIFLGAPYLEALRERRALRAALSGITAAVVGVILNLSLWFALHTLFRTVHEVSLGPVRLAVPEPASLDVPALALAALACLATFGLRLGTARTLGGAALLGAGWLLVS